MTALIVSLALLLTPGVADEWEGWEPKRTLPTEALDTLEEQAIVPVVVEEATYEEMVGEYDWDQNRMVRIMWCESQGDPNAVSRTDDWGLFQIHAPIWTRHFGVTRQQLLDPVLNIDIAYRVFAQQGYGAWVCDRLVN